MRLARQRPRQLRVAGVFLTRVGASGRVIGDMRLRILIVVVLLAVWVLWGSVAVAFDHCATMGALCEAPCGLGVLGVPSLIPAIPGLVPTTMTPLPDQRAPTAPPSGLDPVPRSARLSA